MKIKAAHPLRIIILVLAVIVPALMSGCGKTEAEKASESDANGYVCDQGHKFYTSRSVFADKCAQCDSTEVIELYGYVCEIKPTSAKQTPGCGAVTIAPRMGGKSGGVVCKQCQRPVSAVKLPHAKELAAWGAVKAGKEQVMSK